VDEDDSVDLFGSDSEVCVMCKWTGISCIDI
jgi:hypothetical protein